MNDLFPPTKVPGIGSHTHPSIASLRPSDLDEANIPSFVPTYAISQEEEEDFFILVDTDNDEDEDMMDDEDDNDENMMSAAEATEAESSDGTPGAGSPINSDPSLSVPAAPTGVVTGVVDRYAGLRGLGFDSLPTLPGFGPTFSGYFHAEDEEMSSGDETDDEEDIQKPLPIILPAIHNMVDHGWLAVDPVMPSGLTLPSIASTLNSVEIYPNPTLQPDPFGPAYTTPDYHALGWSNVL